MRSRTDAHFSQQGNVELGVDATVEVAVGRRDAASRSSILRCLGVHPRRRAASLIWNSMPSIEDKHRFTVGTQQINAEQDCAFLLLIFFGPALASAFRSTHVTLQFLGCELTGRETPLVHACLHVPIETPPSTKQVGVVSF